MRKHGSTTGLCHICGVHDQLTAEHVPDRAAGNKKPVKVIKFEDVIRSDVESAERSAYLHQGGYKLYSLCGQCNAIGGEYYVPSFKEWSKQGMAALSKASPSDEVLPVSFELYPLRVLKEIVMMFFAVNDAGLGKESAELCHFVRLPKRKYMHPMFRFFIYLNKGGRLRAETMKGIGDIQTGVFSTISEIAYPPFGYVLTLDSDPPDLRMAEITHFSRYDYNDKVTVSMRLPLLRTEVPIAGDYR